MYKMVSRLQFFCHFHKRSVRWLHTSLIFLIAIFVSFSQVISAASEQDSADIPEELLINEPSCFVNRSVNVITGNYHENEVDIEVAGPHPLIFQRSYVSGYCCGNLCYQWNTNHYGEVSVPSKSCIRETNLHITTSSHAFVSGDGGTGVSYQGKVPKDMKEKTCHSVDKHAFHKYTTNSPEFAFTSGSHLKNNRLLYNKKDRDMCLITGDGYKRHYKLEHHRDTHYCLESEEQPNGCVLYYETPSTKKSEASRKISLKNSTKNALSTLSTHYHDHDDYLNIVSGSDGKWVRYRYKKFDKHNGGHRNYLYSVQGSDIPAQTYEYHENKTSKSPKISRKNLPDGRFLCTQYYNERKNNNGGEEVTLDHFDTRIGRVMLQMAPVGTDTTPVITHRFFYHLRNESIEFSNFRIALGGHTTVYDAHHNKTDYHFNDDYRITDICKWSEENQHIYSTERSFWAPNDSANNTNLMARALANGQNEIKLCRSYSYDHNGNPIRQCLWGNLTGKCPGNISLDPNGIPYPSSAECFVKSFTYHLHTPNVLLNESDGKKRIEYTYQPYTNLNTSRLVKEGDTIKKREFNAYDGNGCLQSVMIDDGSSPHENDASSVTERRLTSIFSRTSTPIGLPQIIDRMYVDLDANRNVLLGRVINSHSSTGKLLSQEHYDSENILKYTLEWQYDSMGNMIMEKDAMERVMNRKYDKNRNLIYEEGPLLGVYKEFRYDFVNRLIGVTEGHPDGLTLTSSFRYDLLGNKVAAVDSYGQETRYVYDNQNRLIQTILPIVLDENMAPVNPTNRIEYDLFNNPCRLTDAAGGVTVISYTAHNKPYQKTYPDGTTEKFEYDLSGNLVMSIAQNGTKTFYQYDPFDRLVKKEIYSANDEFIQKESSTYNAFHLLSKTDPDGMTTYHQYDKAGRLVATSIGEMRTEYRYDTLGRESKVSTFFGTGEDNYTAKIKEYDLLNRVIEERVEDSSGNVLTRETYEYDPSGNCTNTRKFNQAGESSTYTEYDTRGQVILMTTALGEQTRIHYRYDYYDEALGQNLPYSESITPNGVATVCVKDALGRKKTEYKKDPFGKLLQKRDYYYTQTGLLSKTVDEVIVDSVSQREIINICKYNSAGKLVETCESAGTPEQKTTKFSYNISGQKQSETKPDGTVLHYDYDALGRLKEYCASDKSFHYVFDYDLNSNPVRVFDRISQTETLKNYDAYNRLIKETLANGLSLEYSYDLSGKPTQMIFPDGSGMGLSYENLFLKEVFRISQQGKKLYIHTYDSYDLSGNVTESTLIGKAGKISYTIDLKGRMTAIANDVWSASILNFDESGNVISRTSQDDMGSYSSEFHYDALNQLIEESGSFQEQYACDSLYNRTRKGNFNYTLNNLNQITNDGINCYDYDPNGNLIRITNNHSEIRFSYDALNRLIKVEKDDQQISYAYDEMNRRIGKTISTLNNSSEYVCDSSFKYFHQGQNEIGCYQDGKLTELRLLGIGKGAEIGAAIAMEFNNTVYAPIHDLNGNVICLIEADTGNVKEFYRYNGFGEETLYDQQGRLLQTAINPWRFSSKRTDNETGFVYFGRRYYDSTLGRWITPDPIGFEGGPNLYAYVMNNPITNLDLYGLYAAESSGATGSERSAFSGVRDFVSSVFEKACEGMSSIYNSIREGLSNFTSRLSERFSFYREERQIRFNQKILASPMNRQVSSTIVVGSNGYMSLGFTNGMETTVDQNISHAEIISNIAGGGQVSSTVNPTNGLIHDTFRAFHSLYFDLASNVLTELHKKWDTHFEKYGLQKAWLEICHSEGTINVRNALMCYNPELRKMIDVVAIAPACYIDPRLCRRVAHYVSTRDFVPLFDLRGRIKYRETVHVLSPHKDANFWDHDFQSSTYRKAIKLHVQQHLRDNGY